MAFWGRNTYVGKIFPYSLFQVVYQIHLFFKKKKKCSHVGNLKDCAKKVSNNIGFWRVDCTRRFKFIQETEPVSPSPPCPGALHCF